jgi:hypothetical protein
MTLDVGPGLAENDCSDDGMSNTELGSHRSVRLRSGSRSDLSHLVIGQLGMTSGCTSHYRGSTLGVSILGVLDIGAKPPMLGRLARRCVTRMAHAQTITDRTDEIRVAEARCNPCARHLVRDDGDAPVPVFVPMASPQAAPVLVGGSTVREVSIKVADDGWIVSRAASFPSAVVRSAPASRPLFSMTTRDGAQGHDLIIQRKGVVR